MHRERIAACLIVQNEQQHLPAALASVAFCDEIVVVDGGSTDRTVEIARAAGATVIENPWPGFAIQRNLALDATACEWVIEVDADERVSPRLRESIQEMLATPPPGVALAVCPLRHRFLGRLLGPSAKYPAYRSRTFRPGVYRHDERRTVHEGVEPRERSAILEGDLEHELAGSLREALRDMWSYARLESLHVAPPTAASYLKGIVLRPLAKAAYRTIVDRGWRDGWRGLLKISLDVGSDVLVWVLVLARRNHAEVVQTSSARPLHFGRRSVGPPKVLAFAAAGRPAQAAARWLAELQARGADVVLVSRAGASESEVPLRAVARFRPLEVMRAIDLEAQVREIDAVVAFGRGAQLIRRLLPGTLRPEIAGLTPDTGAERVIELANDRQASGRRTLRSS
jgi:glycosyltransferase involved in cell wall biosynthesis